jgi:hypothetical protein
MRHLRLFESFEDIDSICKRYNITNYTINSDGLVDVDGGVNLYNRGLTKLPLKFGKVTGNFDCSRNQLTTLEGAPNYVGGSFNCSYNQLTTLEGSPDHIGGYFNCYNNQLTTLEGGPSYVGGGFYCGYNQLTTLEGAPSYVGGSFYCYNNQLTKLEGCPDHVGDDFYCDDNPICSIYRFFPNYKSFISSLDYNYLRGTDIVKIRFKEALEEIGKKVPRKIEGYNWI